MTNSITERYLLLIKELIATGDVADGNGFAKKVGLSPSAITEMNKGRTNVGLSAIQKTVSTYPSINLDWLISGDGEIFKTKTPKNVINKNDNKLDNIFDNERKLPKTLSIERTETAPIATQIFTDSEGRQTKISLHSPKPVGALYDPPEAPSMLSDVDTPYLAGGGYVEVPVVDIEAAAGGGAQNSDYMDEVDNMRFPVSLLRPTKSKRLCINVAGESMEPTLFDGTRIVVRLLDRSEWGGIRSGDVYVVTNRSGETFIKRVRNKLRLQGVLVLTSDNPDQRRYRPFELSEEEIFNVWSVELMISDNIPPSDREIDDLRDQIGDLRMLIERLAAREN